MPIFIDDVLGSAEITYASYVLIHQIACSAPFPEDRRIGLVFGDRKIFFVFTKKDESVEETKDIIQLHFDTRNRRHWWRSGEYLHIFTDPDRFMTFDIAVEDGSVLVSISFWSLRDTKVATGSS